MDEPVLLSTVSLPSLAVLVPYFVLRHIKQGPRMPGMVSKAFRVGFVVDKVAK
jgi:hypothetical protein